MHSIDENGKPCIDLDHFIGLSDSIRFRQKIDHLIEKYHCPKEIPNFSLSMIFRSGKRYYISNLYWWAVAYRTEGYYRGDYDHLFEIYDGKEYFIQDKLEKDATQKGILEVMTKRYSVYTTFAMVRQCFECDLIIEAYNSSKTTNPEAFYLKHRDAFENFIIGFLDEMKEDICQSLPEYRSLDIFQNKVFRKKVITRELNTLNSVLTQRELQCLFLITQGNSPKEIASILCLSVETINTHFKSVRKKLNCNTINQAVVIAIKSDLFKNNNYPYLGIQQL